MNKPSALEMEHFSP